MTQEPPPPFSCPLYGDIAFRWRAWQRGIPPGRRWRGFGAQNPRLLAAFAVLDRAEARATKARQGQGPPAPEETLAEFRRRWRSQAQDD